MSWSVTVRATGAPVSRERHSELGPALAAVARHVAVHARDSRRDAVDVKVRRFAASELVVARVELAGPQRRLPRVHGGVDVHGDGSATAYRGRLRRRPLEVRGRESATDALRRALTRAAAAGRPTPRA